MRTLWLVEELELTYEHVALEWDDAALKSPEFLARNPSGAIPTIVDDGFALSESMAIAFYLARKHSHGRLYPSAHGEEATALRWSFWAQGELEPFVQLDARTAELRAQQGLVQDNISKGLQVLERALSARSWLAADRFTVADLNVAGVLSPSRASGLDFSDAPAAREWLDRCYARPAALAARRRFGGLS